MNLVPAIESSMDGAALAMRAIDRDAIERAALVDCRCALLEGRRDDALHLLEVLYRLDQEENPEHVQMLQAMRRVAAICEAATQKNAPLAVA